jgi:hypothetical protein
MQSAGPQQRMMSGHVGAAVITIAIAFAVPSGASFLTTALWFVLPQLALCGLAGWLARTGATALGVAIALAVYLALFIAWVRSHSPDGLIWLSYWSSLPGAALGALAGGLAVRWWRSARAGVAFGVGFATTAIGIATNQATLCATVVHCAW